MKVIGVATKRNTIAVVDSSADKSKLAVMMIRAMHQSLRLSGAHKLIMFLANSDSLVRRQYEILKLHSKLKVGECCGDMSRWNAKTWDVKVSEHHVLVMTPRTLLDALRTAFLSIDSVCLVILDECHCATDHSPEKILKEFYHNCGDKPKILGISTSPAIRGGLSSMKDHKEQMSELKSLLDAQILTMGDGSELDEVIPPGKQVCKFHGQAATFN